MTLTMAGGSRAGATQRESSHLVVSKSAPSDATDRSLTAR